MIEGDLEACALLGKDGKRGPAVLFLFLEAASVVLDFFERSKWASLAAFLLSAFGFVINIYVCYLEKTSAEIKPPAERQLGIVEIVFSVLQLIATLIHFILLASDVKYNYRRKITNSSIAKDSSDDDSVLGTPIELDMRGTVMNHGNLKNKLRFRSRLFKEEGPGIEQFQIDGEATPGKKLLGCGYPVGGANLCMFQWVRHLQDGTKHYIKGAIGPEYVVTADDVGKLISVECIPMDDQGHMVYIQNNDSVMSFLGPFCPILFMTEKLKTDPEMQSEIDMHMSKGEASFSVLLLVPSSENQGPVTLPATLILRRSSFQIKINSTEYVVIEEKFTIRLSIKIPSGLPTELILTCSDGASHCFSTSDFRTRDALVLTMRMFQNQAKQVTRAKRIKPDE
ncbi:hypothetical protein KPL71_012613 [Citrus sinensis]|uniref:Uncharacterized protein n=1 Tax=Citrus sinensis TaxID=2711 RepID=A0ACB8LCG7_CITSI|nr:hypothetical protein KPL71_012613 [Citrus sinensis]